MTALKRSNDRKTANLANAKGDGSKIKNAFGLPAGREYSCPGETNFCGSICYGKRAEGYLPSVRNLLMHNWDLLQGASVDDMTLLLTDMITDFVKDCDKHDASKMFRIHWDGDFFSLGYTMAWSRVISAFPDVQFWAYTRNHRAAAFLAARAHDNLGLYFSADPDNADLAESVRREHGVKIATLADTFDEARSLHREITGARVGKCPEVAGRIPLITTEGGACKSCALCPTAKTDITFSVSGR
jgi:hypothetical protein